MILGVGIDSIDVARVERQLAEQAGLMQQLFTPAEMAFCASRRQPGRIYAAFFAAKEAFLKALGTGWRGGIRFTDIAISLPAGRPASIELAGETRRRCDQLGVRRTCLSLSCLPTLASAIVILEI